MNAQEVLLQAAMHWLRRNLGFEGYLDQESLHMHLEDYQLIVRCDANRGFVMDLWYQGVGLGRFHGFDDLNRAMLEQGHAQWVDGFLLLRAP